MDTALYYTFSTIAQTLAAAIAFLGAFALYRLQSLTAALESTAEVLSRHQGVDAEVIAAQLSRDYAEFDRLLDVRDARRTAVMGAEYQVLRTRFQIDMVSARHVRRSFFRTLLPTSIVILGSISVLMLTPRVVSQPRAVTLTCVLGLVGLVVCLVTYVAFVRQALGVDGPRKGGSIRK